MQSDDTPRLREAFDLIADLREEVRLLKALHVQMVKREGQLIDQNTTAEARAVVLTKVVRREVATLLVNAEDVLQRNGHGQTNACRAITKYLGEKP